MGVGNLPVLVELPLEDELLERARIPMSSFVFSFSLGSMTSQFERKDIKKEVSKKDRIVMGSRVWEIGNSDQEGKMLEEKNSKI
ncbi:outer membrane efflux protein [Leptospira ryugenii]|uniref:Outer membrane efflux protein n=1 Tax=Leptospira ryugenii TaxID=1917863 RepID=A0A2P2DV60_9LEPT|nr:outer membrane efflux protein [Leptospira ryugenii]